MRLDQKALEAAIRADQWPANLHAIVDAVNAASDDNDLSTEQCVALGIILASRSSAIIEEPMAGWKLVPVEATVAMQNAAIDVDSFKLGDISPIGFRISPQMLFEKCYRAMLAAAPPSPQPHTGRAGPVVEEMAEALRKCLYTSTGNKIAAENVHVFERAAKALEAYRALNAALTVEPEAGEVTVKPLEWRNVDSPDMASDAWWYEAYSPFGNYTITFVERHTLPWLLEPFFSGLDSNYATEAEAKAAAQADYTARIRSALAP